MEYFRRFVWFLASRLLVLVCVLGIAVTGFYFAMNAANVRVIAKDGFAKRAQVIMMGEDAEPLSLYFSLPCQGRDEALQLALNGQSVYQNYYKITGFDHRLSLNSVWCWPWEDTATAVVTEEIRRIDGKAASALQNAPQELGLTSSPPKWGKIQYTLLLSRENGRWLIKNMTAAVLSDE